MRRPPSSAGSCSRRCVRASKRSPALPRRRRFCSGRSPAPTAGTRPSRAKDKASRTRRPIPASISKRCGRITSRQSARRFSAAARSSNRTGKAVRPGRDRQRIPRARGLARVVRRRQADQVRDTGERGTMDDGRRRGRPAVSGSEGAAAGNLSPGGTDAVPARFLLVRASVDKAPVLAMTERALKEIDPGEPVPGAASVSTLLDGELKPAVLHARSASSRESPSCSPDHVFGMLGAFVAQRSAKWACAWRSARPNRHSTARACRIGWPAALGLSAGTVAAAAAAPRLGPLLFHVARCDGVRRRMGGARARRPRGGGDPAAPRAASNPVTLLRREG